MNSPRSLESEAAYPIVVGRYALFEPIASGGMASVHIGRLLGSFGFARTVAIKRLHQNLARDPEFLAMFLDEARVAARIRHPNVVPTLDVVALDGELLLVMEYCSGAALSRILTRERQAGRLIPHRIAVDIIIGVLNGLHAAHEAKDESGEPLEVVHRDVSPQNILVGTDGTSRVLDFGIAKAVGGAHLTRPNQLKGKLRYLSPESVDSKPVTRASDIFAASIVLWEMLAGQRLFDGEGDGQILMQVLSAPLLPPSRFRPHISSKLDEVVMCGLARDPAERYATARAMALALEAAVTPVSRSLVSEWLSVSVGEEIHERDRCVARVEREIRKDAAHSNYAQAPTPVTTRTVPHLVEVPAESRTGSFVRESGSAPSLSLVIERQASNAAPVTRLRQLVWLAAAAGALAIVAAAYSRTRGSDVEAGATPALIEPDRLVALPVSPSPSPSLLTPEPTSLSGAPTAPLASALATVPSEDSRQAVAPTSAVVNAGAVARAIAPKSGAGKPSSAARRPTSAAAKPKPLVMTDRIYKRD